MALIENLRERIRQKRLLLNPQIIPPPPVKNIGGPIPPPPRVREGLETAPGQLSMSDMKMVTRLSRERTREEREREGY